MKQFSSLSEMAAFAAQCRTAGAHLALVPTLGSLHAGKQALIRAAAEHKQAAVVSIFVNPLQFGPNEPFGRYPRDLEADLAACRENGAAAVLTPSAEEMLPPGFGTYVTEETLGKTLCGPSRPGHFRGVTTLTARLLNAVQPQSVYIGQKTAQRAAVVRKMVADLAFPVDVRVVGMVREPDGLAAATANTSFTESQRKEALAISRALVRAKEMAEAGTRSPDRLIAEATHILNQHRRVRTIYISIVHRQTLLPTREVTPGEYFMAIAAWVDEVRLIDNQVL
jgi:pantoate--beta-alanine ligase